MKVNVGDKVKVPNEKMRYTVMARNKRYIICTKPFNARHTVLYFIVDLETKMRGPDNMVFCFGYETKEQCEERLKDLQCGRATLSGKHSIPLDIDIQ